MAPMLYSNSAGSSDTTSSVDEGTFEPIAICGMACRLPGGVSSPADLWEFLVGGKDGRCRVPKSRYNIGGHYSATKRPGTVDVEYGYFLDESVDLAGIDTSFTGMSRAELELLDPQQRLLLEVTREALHDAGATGWAGSNMGVYIGSFGEDWHDLLRREEQLSNLYAIGGSQDYMVSARVSHELDLRGPNMTIRTACSSSMIALNEACAAIAKGDCEDALVGGSNLILAPNLFVSLSGQGVLSADGSSRSLSAEANGYARGEGVVAVYVKALHAALRDGNPIRSVVAGCAANSDGKTQPFSMPSAAAQAALIRRTYALAGVDDVGKTALFECHATGTATGDPIECAAVAEVFGGAGVYVGTVKPNMGHSESASGLTAVLKATLALEHRVIPPNIKFAPLNPRIPFDKANLRVPAEPTPWPHDRHERISVNSFGIGGSNAHLILESPARFLPRAAAPNPNPVPHPDPGPGEPQLLLFSANSAAALKNVCHSYQDLLETSSHSVADVAYTLANGREHLPHRSFAVASASKFEQGVSLSVAAKRGAAREPSVVLVFTGQGAAWPQMGRDLVRTNATFARSIKLLDTHLARLGADWSLKDELLKPARTSRVYEAEFSQPLCTALQLALVDTLLALGVRPHAVVGHSSGEIGAAYAAGALTAEEAIAVAFHRGAATKGQAGRGAMAAVGLGWDAVQPYLVAGVIAACDNSPSSVTLSGDADKLADVVATIKEALPGVPATILKVENAYHSHHMLAFGESYHQAMTHAKVVGRPPQIPFFSSVTGELLTNADGSVLGPRYWQSNLERPVLFNAAVQAITKSPAISNPILLEIGPHSALAGPVRQILSAASSNAAYIPTLVRRQNSAENLLQVLGKLYTQHVALDLKSIVSTPAALVAGLPRYPWDHTQRFWFESRLSRDWLDRKHIQHPLLGSRVLASTDLEPSWRNLLSVKTTPWIAHHKLGASIVFPLAAFVSIAAEAGRQLSGIDDGVSLRNLIVHNAFVIDGEASTELITSLRRERLTDTATSEWWEFTISSYNGHGWTKHASGDVRAEVFDSQLISDEHVPELPRKVDSVKLYNSVRKAGLDYGPTFDTLRHIRTATTSMAGTATMQNNQWGDEADYHLHPIVLDTYYQLMSCAIIRGIGRDYRRMVAAKIDRITMFRNTADELDIFTSASPTNEGYIADGWVSDGSKKVLSIVGSHSHVFDETTASDEHTIPIAARSEWVPHVDFQDNRELIRQTSDHKLYLPLLEELAELAITLAKQTAQDIVVQTPHLTKYRTWLLDHKTQHHDTADTTTLTQEVSTLSHKLKTTPAASAASAIVAVSASIEAILKGEKTGWEVLNDQGSLDDLKAFLIDRDDGLYINSIAYTKPNFSVLKIGSDLGGKTSRIIDNLTRVDGQPLYSRLVIADASVSKVNTIKEDFKAAPNTKVRVLDLGKDLADQDFQDDQFDLIIATHVVSGGDNIQNALDNLYRLLRPNGRLLLEEPQPGSSWAQFALGTLSDWWSHAEDLTHVDGPFLSSERWHDALTTAGFLDIDHVEPSAGRWTSNVLIARPQAPKVPAKRVTLLVSNAEASDNSLIVNELTSRNYEIDTRVLGQTLPRDQDVVALLDEQQPFLESIDAAQLSQFKTLVSGLGNGGLLWVTRLSSTGCTDPRYAQILGLARALRSELSVDFATLETDQILSSVGAHSVANVLSAFQTRADDGVLGPDLEYVIHEGRTLVSRIFPFSLDKELIVSQPAEDSVLTQDHPGRLNTLVWSATSAVAPKNDEVEVEIYATGLNFRDVLVGMQIIPGSDPKFGYEASGIVRRVGPKATRVAVGDRVVTIGSNLFSTATTSSEVYFERLPDNVSFVEGACIPLVFITALYGLRDVGRVSQGRSVLIHSAAGGVGLAAIQVARMLEAEIFVTVGSERKVQYLMETYGIPRNRIFNSRNSSFVEDVLRETGGKGVDVVLNSLAGELLHATWKCVARWGTMVEIGKRDLLGNGRLDMSPFLANRNYCCFDVDLMTKERPELLNQLLKSVMDGFAHGNFKPIRVDQVFEAPQVLDAFRYMQQGKHIGKIVVELRNSAGKLSLTDVNTTKKAGAELNDASSYLLVGGLGGLGRSISVWMAQRGARHFTFLSRNAGNGVHDASFVVELESMGCTVQLVKGDVTNPADVARAVDGVVAPLKGIVQMSMVLRDQMFDGMSIEDWNAVTRPKVQGTWNLHNASVASNCNLDFFLLFSSLSGIVGQVGQANYASANTFLDAFVQYRASQGLPCSAVDLGAMEGVGYLSNNQELLKRMQGTGWSVLQETDLLGALPFAFMPPTLRSQRKHDARTNTPFLLGLVPTSPLSSPESSSRLKRDVRLAVYHNLGGGSTVANSSAPDALGSFLASAKKNPSILKADGTVQLLAVEVGKKLCGLVLADETDFEISANMSDLGLDSLVAVELRGWWKLTFGFEISTLDMLGLGTLEAMGRRIAEGLIAIYNA